jgi:hypothetical protein
VPAAGRPTSTAAGELTGSLAGDHHVGDRILPVRLLPDVYNPRAPGGRGAHIGTSEPARLEAVADTKQFVEQHLVR